jgi:predicted ATPase
VVATLRRCVPEIEALSFYDDDEGRRAIQVEQAGLPNPVPLNEASDGTRLVLALLTLVNQETPPPVLLLEDIDRGLHPRLYEELVDFLRTLAAEGRTQILATTHDPYLIDEFRDAPEAVVIVEKKDGASTLSNLDERLAAMLEPGEELEMPLGQVWFSGLVGGVPVMKLPEILKPAGR